MNRLAVEFFDREVGEYFSRKFNGELLIGLVVVGTFKFPTHVEENARKKAIAYARALGRSVLSMDVALYFNDLPDAQQPGLHVRRIRGRERPNDVELLAYYSELAKSMGDRIDGYWRYGFALADPAGHCVSFSHDTQRIFTSQPSSRVVEGYPLESLQIDPVSGKYISELSSDELAVFWRTSVGVPLAEFVAQNY